MHLYSLNLEPLARGHLEPWDLGLNKLGKGPQAMLHTKFQTPVGWLFGLGFNGPLRQYFSLYRAVKHLSQAVLEKKIFKYISFLQARTPAAGPI